MGKGCKAIDKGRKAVDKGRNAVNKGEVLGGPVMSPLVVCPQMGVS